MTAEGPKGLQCFAVVWACDVNVPHSRDTEVWIADSADEKKWLRPLHEGDSYKYTRNAEVSEKPRKVGGRIMLRTTGTVEFCVYGPKTSDSVSKLCVQVAAETALEMCARLPVKIDEDNMNREFCDDILTLPTPTVDPTASHIAFCYDVVPVDLTAQVLSHPRCGKEKQEIRLRAAHVVQLVGTFQACCNIVLSVPYAPKVNTLLSDRSKPKRNKRKHPRHILYTHTCTSREDALLDAHIHELTEEIQDLTTY